MINFKNIDYLKYGNNRQKEAYIELKELQIFEKLKAYNPILSGTIPLGIDLPNSDLDIVCECENNDEFSDVLYRLFVDKNRFEIKTKVHQGIKSTVAKFETVRFIVEIFGQNIPSDKQNAYRHMLIEYKILQEKGPEFKSEIIKLKHQGLSTEAAFTQMLGIEGNPYDELLKLEE